MEFPHVNMLAVLVGAVVIFLLGGVWYSPALFAKKWIALTGRSEAETQAGSGAMPVAFLFAFVCGFLTSWAMAVILAHVPNVTASGGAMVGGLCWIGFAGATSFANAVFSQKPKALWLIDSGYNLVSFVVAGIILAAWR